MEPQRTQRTQRKRMATEGRGERTISALAPLSPRGEGDGG